MPKNTKRDSLIECDWSLHQKFALPEFTTFFSALILGDNETDLKFRISVKKRSFMVLANYSLALLPSVNSLAVCSVYLVKREFRIPSSW